MKTIAVLLCSYSKKKKQAIPLEWINAEDFIYIVNGLKITREFPGLNYTCPIGTESNDSLIFSENISFSFQMSEHLHSHVTKRTFLHHFSKVKIQMHAF
jgi:hypothetical protein